MTALPRHVRETYGFQQADVRKVISDRMPLLMRKRPEGLTGDHLAFWNDMQSSQRNAFRAEMASYHWPKRSLPSDYGSRQAISGYYDDVRTAKEAMRVLSRTSSDIAGGIGSPSLVRTGASVADAFAARRALMVSDDPYATKSPHRPTMELELPTVYDVWGASSIQSAFAARLASMVSDDQYTTKSPRHPPPDLGLPTSFDAQGASSIRSAFAARRAEMVSDDPYTFKHILNLEALAHLGLSTAFDSSDLSIPCYYFDTGIFPIPLQKDWDFGDGPCTSEIYYFDSGSYWDCTRPSSTHRTIDSFTDIANIGKYGQNVNVGHHKWISDDGEELIRTVWALLRRNEDIIRFVMCFITDDPDAGHCILDRLEAEEDDPWVDIDVYPEGDMPWWAPDSCSAASTPDFSGGRIAIQRGSTHSWHKYFEEWTSGNDERAYCAAIRLSVLILHELAHICLRSVDIPDLGESGDECAFTYILANTYSYCMFYRHCDAVKEGTLCVGRDNPGYFLSDN